MKVVQINSVCGSGSTGKICVAISQLLTDNNIENYILYAIGNSTYDLGKRYMSPLEVKFQALKTRIFGNYGFQSKAATKRLIRELDRISPDVIQLHNLHSHNVHLGLLFSYIKEKKIKVYWTFHDCWAFTSYCMYFDLAQCDKWKSGCKNCPQHKKYSWFFDRSRDLYKRKRELTSDIDLTIITPSCWLEELIKYSFLKEFPVRVINNGIDLSVFRPVESNVKEIYNISENRFVLLGVANVWEKRKGLDVFIELALQLDSERFQIVLVGTNDAIDRILPPGIVSIHKTANQNELAEIYSSADIFINPTREDNYPTTQMESIACGTPVVAFDTGGCSETIDESCGRVVEKNDIDSLIHIIEEIYESRSFSKSACTERAHHFDMHKKYNEYIELYLQGMNCKNE